MIKEEEVEDIIYWLLDTTDDKYTRGTGRTKLLIKVYSRLLKDNLGKEFIIRDHFPNTRADRELAKRIKSELEEDILYKVSINDNKLTLYTD